MNYLKKLVTHITSFFMIIMYMKKDANSDRDMIIPKSLHSAWDEEIMKDLADLDINEQSDERCVASKFVNEVGCKSATTRLCIHAKRMMTTRCRQRGVI